MLFWIGLLAFIGTSLLIIKNKDVIFKLVEEHKLLGSVVVVIIILLIYYLG